MAPLPKNSIDHFIHPGHPLKALDGEQEFQCDGCKTLGAGKRYRCGHAGCDFDLHEYCGTCPRFLTSFMHPSHALTLVMRKGQGERQVDRVCDVCSDPVEGLFYRCKECQFDVHPLCTQLPEKLKHALHEIHPLTLRSSRTTGACAVCRGSCTGWRYRCGICNFDIHLECILVPVVQCPQNAQSNQRGIPGFDKGIPFQPPPQFTPYYGFPYGPGPGHGPGPGPGHYPGYHPYGPGYNMYNPGYQYMYPNNYMPQNQVAATSNGTGRNGKSMFSLVGQLGFGVLSNMIFGVDISSLFSG